MAACVALWLFAATAAANTFVKDRREQRDASLPLFRSVGMLVHPDAGGGGTAFLVSACHVVTAHHVAFPTARDGATGNRDPRTGQAGGTALFLVGPHRTKPGRFAARASATVVDAGNFSAGSFDGTAGDWAILRLDKCLGNQFGFLRYARGRSESPMPRGDLMTIGFPRSRAGQAGITVETGCRARDHGPVDGLIGVDCAFEAGMSGGPVLERQADGRWLVIGLVQQSTGASDRLLPAYSMADRNQVVSVTAFRNALDAVLRAEGKRVLAKR